MAEGCKLFIVPLQLGCQMPTPGLGLTVQNGTLDETALCTADYTMLSVDELLLFFKTTMEIKLWEMNFKFNHLN